MLDYGSKNGLFSHVAKGTYVTQDNLILDRYEPLGMAGEGGFGTVQVAWDPRIQRRVAIKTIRITALDAARASLPGAQAVSQEHGASGWHDVQSWADELQDSYENESFPADPDLPAFQKDDETADEAQAERSDEQVTYLAHLPGLDEARTAAMLVDPRIVTVYDFEVRGRDAYLIMEYVEGITLTSLLQDYADYMTLDMLAAIFDAVAGALMAAHAAGVLHLDIKPDNILISTQGQVKVTDFGLATLADAAGEGRAGGGTIGYMPPEQIRREQLDARADEWALASVTYEMLTGSNPFRAEGLDAALAAIEQAELVLPSLCWNNIDEQIDDVVFYALDPNRDARYESVEDFAEEVDKFLGDPERGSAQLRLVVDDALCIYDDEEAEPAQDANEVASRVGSEVRPVSQGVMGKLASFFARLDGDDSAQEGRGDALASVKPVETGQSVQRRSLTERFLELLPPDEGEGAGDASVQPSGRLAVRDVEPDLPDDATAAAPRVPFAKRFPDGLRIFASHAFGAIASGLITCLALVNMEPLVTACGPGAGYAIAIMSLIVAALGAVRSHVGALVSLCLLGIAFVMCGHPIVGAVTLVVVVTWWYTIGHEGSASANVLMSLPLFGAVGGACAVPFLAGMTLRPIRSVATTLVVCAFAVILGSFGTLSVLDWNVSSYWDFSRADVTGVIIRMVTRPDVLATLGGWIIASAVLSIARLRESRLFVVLGIVLALVAILVGGLAFSSPSPQLLVPVILAAVILLVLVC